MSGGIFGALRQRGLEPIAGGWEVDGSLFVRGGLGGGPTQGNVYYLDAANGSDNNDGKIPARAFKTLSAAEDAMTANQNDILYYLAGGSSISLTVTLAWDKNFTHLIGVCAPVKTAQRARIFNSGNFNTLMNVSATGCVFKNLYFFQGSSTTAAVNNIIVSGERCYFENVHFAGMGHATPAAETGGNSLNLTGSENLFKDCTIGLDTIVRTTNTELLIEGSATRNIFEDCRFLSFSETAAHTHVKFNDSAAGDRFTIFQNCWFMNFSANHVTTLTEVFDMPATNATFDVLLINCYQYNMTEWDAGNAANLKIVGSKAGVGAAATQAGLMEVTS